MAKGKFESGERVRVDAPAKYKRFHDTFHGRVGKVVSEHVTPEVTWVRVNFGDEKTSEIVTIDRTWLGRFPS